MENTINDLYLKYIESVGKTLESDRYFQYLFEMIQAGSNTLNQTNKVLHKVVDETWLNVIEESLDAIYEIIDKPRRFITTSEEVVPVALAKKITADSVRHLSMNTQFIASNEDGEIHPTRILNVTTEESYDLYENRFVYYLIQRLVTFIDKRTDVIFWSTGDEIRNSLVMESKIDDAYEEIEYKIEMKIKNRQSFAENDSDNMQVFMRIDRVRRLVMALRNSPFCSLMAGCSMVRSPIQRTNLMMKDPNYRTCYKLWQFLESYDDVGYTIEERDSALQFDEEYLIQMYTNLITNYTVFKSILEGDDRNVEEIEVQERELKKPKFIRQIEEEIVDDYNIPDVEVRRVIIEEVTQAQLDAEAKLEEEIGLRKAAEEAAQDAQLQLENERWRMQMETFEIQQQAQNQVEEAEQECAAKVAQAQIQIEKVQREARAEIAAARKEADERAEAKVAEAKAEAEAKTAEAQADAEAKVAEAKADAEAKAADAKADADAKAADAKADAEAKVAEAQADAEAKIAEAQADAEAKVAEVQADAESKVTEAKARAEREIEEMRRQMEKQLEEMRRQTEAEIVQAKAREAEAKMLEEAAKRREEEAKAGEQEARRREQEAKEREQLAQKLAEKEARARAKAEEKMNENRLSNRIAVMLEDWFEAKNAKAVKDIDEKKEDADDTKDQ